MMEALIWIIFVIGYIAVKFAKIAGKANTTKTAKPNVPRTPAKTNGTSTYARPAAKTRSFAAMPKQEAGVPNVERNCSAEEKHRFENNLSGHTPNLSTAVPNVPSANMHKQPKMSGNRKTARQLYMGDPVPRGTKVIVCSYCAAENIVPSGARNEYKCYFCHYDI